MTYEIESIAVVDQGHSLEVEVTHRPSWLGRVIGRKPFTETYRGNGGLWMTYPGAVDVWDERLSHVLARAWYRHKWMIE